MNPFSVLLIAIITNIFLSRKYVEQIFISLFALLIYIELFINVGYFIKIARYEFTYNEFLLVLLTAVSLVILLKKRIKRKLIVASLLFVFVIAISTASLIYNPLSRGVVPFGVPWHLFFSGEVMQPAFGAQAVKIIIRIIMFIMVAIGASTILTKDKWNKLIYSLYKYGFYMVIFLFGEFVFKNLFRTNILDQIIGWFFGKGDFTVGVLLERGGIVSIQGFTREPSHLAESLFYFGILLLLSNINLTKIKRMIYAVSMLLLISGSLKGGVLGILLFGLLMGIRKKLIVSLFIALILTPLLFVYGQGAYYLQRVFNSIALLGGAEFDITLSEHHRLVSVIETINVFLDKPFLGIGLGTTYAYGFIPTVLVSIGLIGFALWAIFVFVSLGEISKNKYMFFFVIALLIAWSLSGSIGILYSPVLVAIAFQIKYSYLNNINRYLTIAENTLFNRRS